MNDDPYGSERVYEIRIPPPRLGRKIVLGLAALAALALVIDGTCVVQPGYRGVRVTLGRVSTQFVPEGLAFKLPFVSQIIPVSVRQRTLPIKAECYSSNLQQINADLQVLYRVPEKSVVRIYRQYQGDPFHNLIAPRVQEAVKEVTALLTAENIVTNRLEVKEKALLLARKKVGEDFLDIVDLVIEDLSLSDELEQAIEQKMIQQQEAARAQFAQQQAEIDAKTEVIRARGAAEAIRTRSEALSRNPAYVDLQIIQKWDGHPPLAISDEGRGVSFLLPAPKPPAAASPSRPASSVP
ncbi:MAG: prohibitin family protein [Verrucomicrobia bacterium]|nr:prohibitin family protein [Verrucomicrobiota bacterium]